MTCIDRLQLMFGQVVRVRGMGEGTRNDDRESGLPVLDWGQTVAVLGNTYTVSAISSWEIISFESQQGIFQSDLAILLGLSGDRVKIINLIIQHHQRSLQHLLEEGGTD